MNQEMKLTYMMAASNQTVLRKQEIRCKRKAKRQSKENYPTWAERRQQLYSSRMSIRKELRTLHLVRAFVSGRVYRSVENQVREGNEVKVEDMMVTLREFGYFPCPTAVAMWLGA